jgi:hypothetical protein
MPAMRMTVKQVFVLTALLGQWPACALAFSADGHRVVGAIAETYLCAEARDYIAPLLQGNTLANAGVWADAIRDDPAWEHTKPWHYINVGDREPMERAMGGSQGDVLTAIAASERELADRRLPLPRRAEALRFLVHFIADVHQPLHVGRAEDRGGNDVEVRWGGNTMSLHEVWDGRLLLASERLGASDLAAAIAALAVGEEARWQASGPLDWAEESRAFRPLVYHLGAASRRGRLSDGYVTSARNVVSLRLAQAGVRVAGRLNRLACPGARPGAGAGKTGQAVEPARPSH